MAGECSFRPNRRVRGEVRSTPDRIAALKLVAQRRGSTVSELVEQSVRAAYARALHDAAVDDDFLADAQRAAGIDTLPGNVA